MPHGFCGGCWNAESGGGEHRCSGDDCRCARCATDADARELFAEVHARLGHGSGYTRGDWGRCPARDAAWRAVAAIFRERVRAPRRTRDLEDDARELFGEVHRMLGDACVWDASPYTHNVWRTVARVLAEREARLPIEEAQIDAEAEAIRREAGEQCGYPLTSGARPGPIWRAVARVVNARVRAGCSRAAEQQDQQSRGLGELALAADEFVRFVAGLPLQDLPLKDQRELREKIYTMKRRVGR